MKIFNLAKVFLFKIVAEHLVVYRTPSNLNFLWSFGSVAGICLVIQILTGLFLSMHYIANVELAFASVEHIMRDVNGGWALRYLHSNGASMFFIAVYIHIFRGLYYGSYMQPRGFVWASGIIIFILMMATGFLGYVLPWGQMSLWGATVITNLFSAIPVVGESIVLWLWGGFSVGNPTLERFYTLHFVLPFVILAAVCLHLALLHEVGSGNPTGIDKGYSLVAFHPFFTIKDIITFFALLIAFAIFILAFPNALGHSDNYILADAMVTPEHIVPEWYFLPYYAILRSIPDKLFGVLAMGASLILLLILPLINTSTIRNTGSRPIFKYFYWLFLGNFILLGWIGQKPVETPYIEIGMFATAYYMSFFLIIIPIACFLEERIFYKKN